MKKLVLLICLFAATAVQAQTREETIAFLKTYYSKIRDTKGYYSLTIVFHSDSIIITHCRAWSKEGCSRTTTTAVNLRDITAISYKQQEYKDFGDNGYEPSAWLLKISTPRQLFSWEIYDKEEENYLRKLKKALIKYAEYSGAKIVSEDMFGD